jgi:hypothetical protein
MAGSPCSSPAAASATSTPSSPRAGRRGLGATRSPTLTNDDFGPLVRRLGFAAAPPGEARLFEQALRDPDVWHPRRGPDCAPGATVRVRGRLWFAE